MYIYDIIYIYIYIYVYIYTYKKYISISNELLENNIKERLIKPVNVCTVCLFFTENFYRERKGQEPWI